MKSMTRNELYLLMKGSNIDDKLSFVEKEVLKSYNDGDSERVRAKRTLSNFAAYSRRNG